MFNCPYISRRYFALPTYCLINRRFLYPCKACIYVFFAANQILSALLCISILIKTHPIMHLCSTVVLHCNAQLAAGASRHVDTACSACSGFRPFYPMFEVEFKGSGKMQMYHGMKIQDILVCRRPDCSNTLRVSSLKIFTRALLGLESYPRSLTHKTYIPKKLYMQSNQID